MPGLEVYLASNPLLVSLSDLAPRIRKLLQDSPFEDTLSADYTAGGAQISVTDPVMWSTADVIEFDDATGSQVRLLSEPPMQNPLTIKPGHNGTANASHAKNVTVLKTPRFGYDRITESLTRSIGQMYPWAYVVAESDVTPLPSSTTLYAAPANFIGLIGATQQTTDTITAISSYGTGGLPISIVPNLGVGLAASTKAFAFPSGFYNTTNVVSVSYAARVTPATLPEGDIADYAVLRTCERLVGAEEMPLLASDTSGPAPPPGTLPGQYRNSSLWFRLQADALKRQIRAGLDQVAPLMRVWK